MRVYIESLTMSSQQPPKKKSKQVENKQGTLLSWVKPCTSDTEPGVVEETIGIESKNNPKAIVWQIFRERYPKQVLYFVKVNTNGKLETRTQGIVDKCSDLICTLTVGPKREGGGERELIVNVGHSQIILSLLRAWPRRHRGSVNISHYSPRFQRIGVKHT